MLHNDYSSFKHHFGQGAEWYGTDEAKKALSYKIQLTPSKINTIMETAKNTDEGLLTVYTEFSNETQKVDQAFDWLNPILFQYRHFKNEKIKELSNMSPPGAKAPYVGLFIDAIDKIKGGTRDKRAVGIWGLSEDFKSIIDKYFNKGLTPIVSDYVKSNKYIQDGIAYVNMMKGTSDFREKINSMLVQNNNNYKIRHNDLRKNLTVMGTELSDNFAYFLSDKKIKDSEEIIKRIGRYIITLGLT